jgi:hypothetical protein
MERTPPEPITPPEPVPHPHAVWTPWRTAAAVVLLLVLHVTLAASSLVRENPTVDEVAHLPAGISYWQTGTFRLYAQNPPLVKLAAALPVVLSQPHAMDRIYTRPSWRSDPPIQASIAHEFAVDNAERYFELFTLARLVVPLFSVAGGLFVFAWSRELFGPGGGVLSLALWVFCPNVLAHARLVTTDIGASALGVGATWLFWRYARRPSWRRASLAGIALGVAVLAKFSNLVLFGVWPVIGLAELLAGGTTGLGPRVRRMLGQAAAGVLLAVWTINLGYGFEGTGKPLGSFRFASSLLTKPRPPGVAPPPPSANGLLNLAWKYRMNRFDRTPLGYLPVPLPAPFLTGFDLQKIDAEGIPRWFIDPHAPREEVVGYPVYLDGELRSSGWWYYYLAALTYKVPEGTWLLGLLALIGAIGSRQARLSWADELAVAVVPVVVVLAMSLGTDINLGLRYILPAFPYAFVWIGRLAPWAGGLQGGPRRLAIGAVLACLVLTVVATATIHPHYLAYFNRVSGGPGRGSEHLIDSNLDWGQDLVNLRDRLRTRYPGERVGLAYFGQINPNILRLRGEGFDWFLAPAAPGTIRPVQNEQLLDGPPPRLAPGLYAVSASFVRGLPYSIYDPSTRVPNLYPGWDSRNMPGEAFGYFRELKPVDHVGYSILLYRVTTEDAARLGRLWEGR